MFTRTRKTYVSPLMLESLIFDGELALRQMAFGTDEYNEAMNTLFKLQEMKKRQEGTTPFRVDARTWGDIAAVLGFVLAVTKPELVQKYMNSYWEWRLFNLFR